MTTPRELQPHELAKRDQLLAQAADDAATPGHHAIVVVDVEPPGTVTCSMCDCLPVDADPASHDPARCTGCPEPAASIVIVEYRGPYESRAAVCPGHLDRGLQIITSAYRRAYPDVAFTVTAQDWHDA